MIATRGLNDNPPTFPLCVTGHFKLGEKSLGYVTPLPSLHCLAASHPATGRPQLPSTSAADLDLVNYGTQCSFKRGDAQFDMGYAASTEDRASLLGNVGTEAGEALGEKAREGDVAASIIMPCIILSDSG